MSTNWPGTEDPTVIEALLKAKETHKTFLFDSEKRGTGVAMPCGCLFFDDVCQYIMCSGHEKWRHTR